MAGKGVKGSGTQDDLWQLSTPSWTSQYQMYFDETAIPLSLECVSLPLRVLFRVLD